MPLVRFDLNRGRSPEEIQQILDITQSVVVNAFGVPVRDRYQIVHQHGPGEMIIEDTGLGIARSDKVVVISIVSRTRTIDQIRKFYHDLATALDDSGLVTPNDLMINITFNSDQGWSFGNGRGQFIEGDFA